MRHGVVGADRPWRPAELDSRKPGKEFPELLGLIHRPLPELVVARTDVDALPAQEGGETPDAGLRAVLRFGLPDHLAVSGMGVDDHALSRAAEASLRRSAIWAAVMGSVPISTKRTRAVRVGAVGPRVAGGALHGHVAGAHGRLTLIDQQGDFALEDDGVVQRVGAVEPEVLRSAVLGTRFGLVMAVELAEDHRARLIRIDGVRREVGDAQDRLAGGGEAGNLGVGRCRVARR